MHCSSITKIHDIAYMNVRALYKRNMEIYILHCIETDGIE